jgi:hypothetical protein
MSADPCRWPEIRERTRAIVAPEARKRIETHYGQEMNHGSLPQTALKALRRRFSQEPGFVNQLIKPALVLAKTVFDPENPNWGQWPEDVLQCTTLGLILGILFEKLADQIVLNLSEEDLAVLEAKSRADSLSLCDLLFDYITRCKQSSERQQIR